MRRCVRYRNLKNVEVMARVGPQRHGGEKKLGQTSVIIRIITEYMEYGR